MILSLLGVLCLLLAALFLLPLTMDVCHIGMLYPAAVLVLIALPCLFPKLWRKLNKKLRAAAVTVLIIGLTAMALLFLLMGMAAADVVAEDDPDPPRTVIVLGCRTHNGAPGTMLQNRIDAAYDYLLAHPEAVVITTGGRDHIDDPLTQGKCAADALIAMGIDPKRIYAETRSFDTRENFLFAAAIIEEHGLDTRAAVASDNFHQLRAHLLAREAGLDPCAAGCASPPLLMPGYACREVLGILAAVLGFS